MSAEVSSTRLYLGNLPRDGTQSSSHIPVPLTTRLRINEEGYGEAVAEYGTRRSYPGL